MDLEDFNREEPEQAFEAPLKKNIVLAGMSGAGKTTVGTLLARLTGRILIDTDALIEEKAGKKIRKIFEEIGEAGFRDMETSVIRELENTGDAVISTGGGAVLRRENVESLKKNGIIFFLERNLKDIEPSDERPLADSLEKIEALYASRYPLYKRIADETVHLKGTPEEAAQEILERYRDKT